MDRAELIDTLRHNRCEVTFTKINGETRVMPCTLNPQYLPESKTVVTEQRKRNENVVSVWVTDIHAWRSFRVENVTHVKILEE